MLRVEQISVKAGSFQLRDISFQISKGQYVALLGPTGTGKTLLLESLAGLRRIRGGRIFLEDRDITHLPPEQRNVGVVYQDFALFPHLTVFGNIAFGLKIRGGKKDYIKNSVTRLANFFEIGHLLERKPTHLSGGERQRVALARALVLDPKVLLLDEPLAALDRPTRERIRKELKRIHKELKVSIFHITHDIGEAFFLGEYLLIMKSGQIIQKGTPEDILKMPKNRFVANLLGIPNILPAEFLQNGILEIKGMGTCETQGISAFSNSSRCSGYIAIHGWAVEFFPSGENGNYLWKGNVIIREITPANGHVEIELRSEGNVQVKTSLSQREIRDLGRINVGSRVPVGILKEGVHWMLE